MIGEKVAGAVLTNQLGEGTLGLWFEGEVDGEKVAVHALGDGASPAEREGFLKAVRKLKGMGGEPPEGVLVPSVVDTDNAAFATQLVNEGTVADIPALRLDLNRRLLLVATLAEALEKLHERGIVHGAVSPQSVLLDGRYRPWLAAVDGENVLVGTRGDVFDDETMLRYASPEARANAPLDARSDVYGVGRIIHYLLTSRHPQEEDEELPRLEALAMSPAGLVRIVRKCTCRRPADRYQSIDELIGDLSRFGQYDDVGIGHPEIEERNVTGISASALPPRFDRRARRMAQEKADQEAALLSLAPDGVSPKALKIGAAVGGLLLVVICAAASFVRIDPLIGLVTSMIGGALLALLLPTGKRRIAFNRMALMAGAAALVFAIDPVHLIQLMSARGDVAGTGSPAGRGHAARVLVSNGERDFAGADLTGADLSRLDLAGADFEGATLQSANFERADLNHANLSGANLRAATFNQANLTEVDLAAADGWAEAYCDDETFLPDGFGCRGNLLVREGSE